MSIADRLGDLLTRRGQVRVGLAEVLADWNAAAPHLLGRLESTRELAAALDLLAGQDLVRLPAAGSWDRSTVPPLPKFVTVPAARTPAPDRPWQRAAWRPELGWVASLRHLSPDVAADLAAVNRWLSGPGPASATVPMRMRSAEVFGDEKRLESLTRTTVFGPGRVTLELLNCRRMAPPIASTSVSEASGVLVVENADPYWALVDVLAGHPVIGRVAWGAGAAVEQSILSLWDVTDPGQVFYWGDLDPAGVRIAARAASAVAGAGAGVLLPHHGLWAACGQLRGTGSVDWSGVDLSWLGASAGAVSGVVEEGARVAQERLTLPQLRAAVQPRG